MATHKGKPDKDWTKAVKNAADKAKDAGDEGENYTLTTQVTREGGPETPIRDYTVTLSN